MTGNVLEKKEIKMAANVESMFSTREKPWHGLGTVVEEAPLSADALRLAGLDWNVVQKDIFTQDEVAITPVRVVCNNLLNLALNAVSRSFSMIHAGDVREKIRVLFDFQK